MSADLLTPAITPDLRVRKRPVTLVICLVILGAALFAAAFGGLLFPNATQVNVLGTQLPPGSPGHLLGTDQLGRDIVALCVAGAASTLIGPLVVAGGSMLVGTFFGLLAGFRQGATDFVLGRITDLLLALPVVLLGVVVAGIFGASYWWTTVLLIVVFAPYDIRIVRAGVIEQVTKPYVEAARLLRLSPWRIMYRHLLVNLWPLERTNFLLNYANAIIAMSALSFLGVGVQQGTANWGRQLIDGEQIIFSNPAASIAPAVLIIIVACAVNLLADALNADDRKAAGR
ncbi:MAG TPA: ABC transporter permease [Streptosporangiaceae bacterium]|nr:ABC transporter permease [Streptosporangiaceae bacterium]